MKDQHLPPFSEDRTTTVKTVVGKVDLSLLHRQIKLEAAQKLQPNVAVGDQIEVVTKRGGSTRFLLGADNQSRGLLSRIIHGARISLIVAFVTLGVSGAASWRIMFRQLE